jgi:polar amino acid transport system permease protein
VAEVVRAGLTSIRPGQTLAGLSLGMSRIEILAKVLLPQAVVRMLPAYGSLLTMIIKDTTIASLIAVPDLMQHSQTLQQRTYRGIEIYTIAMALFFIILFPTTRAIELLYRRVAYLGRS